MDESVNDMKLHVDYAALAIESLAFRRYARSDFRWQASTTLKGKATLIVEWPD